MVEKIAESAAKSLTGKTETKQSVKSVTDKLINEFKFFYKEYNFLREATEQAILYCSEEKIMSTSDCPFYFYRYFLQFLDISLGKPYHYDGKFIPRGPELVD